MAIDLKSLRKLIRTKLGTDDLLSLLDRAVELMPPELIPELIEDYIDLEAVSIDNATPKQSLLDEIEQFFQESLAGKYYESFNVNSRNFMEQSRGTINWIAEYDDLMNRCLTESESTEPAIMRKSCELLFKLLDEIDECRDDIIFFADEGGSWQVGVKWRIALPCYFKALAAVAKPQEYAQSIIPLVKNHANHNFDRHIKEALQAANPTQKKALKAAIAK